MVLELSELQLPFIWYLLFPIFFKYSIIVGTSRPLSPLALKFISSGNSNVNVVSFLPFFVAELEDLVVTAPAATPLSVGLGLGLDLGSGLGLGSESGSAAASTAASAAATATATASLTRL